MPVMPSIGGARTFEQAEALARKYAGEAVDPSELAPCDQAQPEAAPAAPAEQPIPTHVGPDAP